MGAKDRLDLLDYRRRVHAHYAQLRNAELSLREHCEEFRRARDELFALHPQSALSAEQKTYFKGLDYYTYDPAWRFVVEVDRDVDPEVFEIPLIDDGLFWMQRIAKVHFSLDGKAQSLALYWVLGYAGGLFLPFRDASRHNGETYGGSRYLLDTIKGADLGTEKGKLILDFNYAYNPSCAYSSRWDCPLAPQENWMDIAVSAGEKAFRNAGPVSGSVSP